MSVRYFLDTNILVYSFDARTPAKAKKAFQLIRQGVGNSLAVISYQVVQEFFNVAFRRFTTPMTAAEGEQYFVTVLRPLLAVNSSPSLYVEAIRLAERQRLSWYDSLIVAAALQARCDVLYSEDFHHGLEIHGLRTENPFL